jgi:hypothetical protein
MKDKTNEVPLMKRKNSYPFKKRLLQEEANNEDM